MAWQIEITPTALEALQAISDRRVRSAIVGRIDLLTQEPEKQGKPLRGWLAGFLSIRAVGQRYRVVYKVEGKNKRVVVYMIGIRKEGSHKDVYALAEHLAQRGLL